VQRPYVADAGGGLPAAGIPSKRPKGERVSCQPDWHPVLFASITQYNRKAIPLITESEQQWKLAPTFS